ADASKAQAPKVEAPKVETPKVETPKVETPQPELPLIIKPRPFKPEKTAPTAGASSSGIVVRHGDHGTYMRIAIEWPNKIGYRIEREGDRIGVIFSSPGDINLKRAQAGLPKDLAQITSVNDKVARVYLTLAPGAKLRDFRLGRTIVLDIMRPVKPESAVPTV